MSQANGDKVRDFSGSLFSRALRPALLAAVSILAAASAWAGGGAGAVFGDSMRLYGGAPEAGTGGVPLERFTNPDSELFTNQSYLTGGVRWVGLGMEVGMFSALKLGFEGVMISADGAEQTEEQADGSYAGNVGKMSASETALRGSLQWNFGGPAVAISARFELEGLSQDIAGNTGHGTGGTGAIFGLYRLNESWHVLGWASGGPFGEGRNADFASSITAGAGLERPGGLGLIGGSEGFRVGAEFEQISGDKAAGGGGLVYWFGGRELDGAGLRLAIRGGFRGEPGSVESSQGRFGIGVTFRDDLGVGWGADYGFVPFGDLGTVHYLSARIKLGLGLFRQTDDSRGEFGGTAQ